MGYDGKGVRGERMLAELDGYGSMSLIQSILKASGVSHDQKRATLESSRVVLSIRLRELKCSRILTNRGFGGGGCTTNQIMAALRADKNIDNCISCCFYSYLLGEKQIHRDQENRLLAPCSHTHCCV